KNADDVINQLSVENWATWNSSFGIKEGNIWLPKFKLEYKLEMADVLKTLGMGIAFSDDADFSGINRDGGLAISRVLHKTFVSVDEEGTEAAAVTIVEIIRTSEGGDNEFYMKVDKPFIFVITEKETGNILFIGKVVKP
ncbi:MAG: serpin family protein, partial [Ignavibacteriaceae bacterium]